MCAVTIALGLLGAQSASALTAADLSSYQFTHLGAGIPNAINNAGQVVGYSAYFRSPRILWDTTDGKITYLDVYGATDINNLGQVVGGGGFSGGFSVPYISNAPYTTFNSLNSDLISGCPCYATAINDSGMAVGSVNVVNVNGKSWGGAVLWDTNNNSMTVLSSTASYSIASDINNAGLAVGIDYDQFDRRAYASLWNTQTNTEINLGALMPRAVYSYNSPGAEFHAGYSSSNARAINDSGLVVGFADYQYSEYPNLINRSAMLWDSANNTFTQLGSLLSNGAIDATTMANDINNSGDIVGWGTTNSGMNATLWSHGNVYNLNDFLDPSLVAAGWVLNEATGINDNGWIVGTAINISSGLGAGFLLAPVSVPVPEPESYALLLAGLGLIGVLRRRQHSLQ